MASYTLVLLWRNLKTFFESKFISYAGLFIADKCYSSSSANPRPAHRSVTCVNQGQTSTARVFHKIASAINTIGTI